MKKKLIFATSLSFFLLLSVIWMAPLEAKAVGFQSSSSSEEKLHEKMKALSVKIKDDPDLATLISLHNNLEIRDIIDQVLYGRNKPISKLADDYISILEESGKTDQVVALLQTISSKYSSDFLEISKLAQECSYIDPKEDIDNSHNCYIQSTVKGVKVTMKETYVPSNNAIVMKGSDLSVKIPGFDLILQSSLDDLADFFWALYELLNDIGWSCVAVADVFGVLGVVFFWAPTISAAFFGLFYFFGVLGAVIMITGDACRLMYRILGEISLLINPPKEKFSKKLCRCNLLYKIQKRWSFLKYDLPIVRLVQRMPAFQ